MGACYHDNGRVRAADNCGMLGSIDCLLMPHCHFHNIRSLAQNYRRSRDETVSMVLGWPGYRELKI